MWREPSKDDEALPRLLVVGISLIGIGLLIANTALVAWFIIRKRIKGKKTQHEILLHYFHFKFFRSFCVPAGFLLFYIVLSQLNNFSSLAVLFFIFNFYLLACCCSCSCSMLFQYTEKKDNSMDIQHTDNSERLLSSSYINIKGFFSIYTECWQRIQNFHFQSHFFH